MCAVGAYAWDQSRNDEIAEGVTIGGVDVGGLTESEARGEVDEALVEPLRRHVVVRYDGVKYQLSPEKLQIDADVDGMVDEALDESLEGGIPTRVWRYRTGPRVPLIASARSGSSRAVRRSPTEATTMSKIRLDGRPGARWRTCSRLMNHVGVSSPSGTHPKTCS